MFCTPLLLTQHEKRKGISIKLKINGVVDKAKKTRNNNSWTNTKFSQPQSHLKELYQTQMNKSFRFTEPIKILLWVINKAYTSRRFKLENRAICHSFSGGIFKRGSGLEHFPQWPQRLKYWIIMKERTFCIKLSMAAYRKLHQSIKFIFPQPQLF